MGKQPVNGAYQASFEGALDDLKFMTEDRIERKRFADCRIFRHYILGRLQVEEDLESKSLEGVLRDIVREVARQARREALAHFEAAVQAMPERVDVHYPTAAAAELLGFGGEQENAAFCAVRDYWRDSDDRRWQYHAGQKINRSAGRQRRWRAAAWIGQGDRTAYEQRRELLRPFLEAVDEHLKDEQVSASLRTKLLSQALAAKPSSPPSVEATQSADIPPLAPSNRRGWKFWTAIITPTLLVAAAGVWAAWPSQEVVADPFTVTAEPLTDQCGVDWLVPRPPATVDMSSRPADSRTWPEWPAVADGVSTAPSYVRLTLQGTSETAVVLNDMYIDVHERKPPISGTLLDAPCGGPSVYRALQVDLDKQPPRPVPEFNPQLVPDNAPHWEQAPIKFPYKISASDAESLLITTMTENCDCTWTVKLLWTSGGRTGATTIDDHGKPFRTSSGKHATPCVVDANAQCKERTQSNPTLPPVNCKVDDVRDAQEGPEAPLRGENVESVSILACASPYAVVTVVPKDMARGEQLLVNFSIKPPMVLLRGAQDPQSNRQEPFSAKQAREAGVDMPQVEQTLGGMKLFYNE